MYKKIKLLGFVVVLTTGVLQAQTDNSPYSRYGIGDQLPNRNIMSRGMGGVVAAYADILSVNYTNPASYARLRRAVLDIGVEVDSRTLKTIDPPRKFSSTSPTISYVQLGLPLNNRGTWGMNIGLRPVSRISYEIERNERLPDIDSIKTIFDGNGGTYEVFTGTGIAFKNLSIGVNVGYMFGSKNYSSARTFIPDSADVFYYSGKSTASSNFGGVFVNGGLQYAIKTSKTDMLRLGAYGSLKRELNASRDEVIRTFRSSQSGEDTIDVISRNDQKGKLSYPSTYGFGMVYHGGDKWLLGADFSQTLWNDYSFFNEKDSLRNSWALHVGGQVTPNLMGAKSYWGRVTYRAGLSYGTDYVKIKDDLSVWTASLGLGLPMRPPTYTNQYSVINLTLEFGRRGNNLNVIRESFFRVGIGLSLSDIWFVKRKYD